MEEMAKDVEAMVLRHANAQDIPLQDDSKSVK